MQQKLVTIYLNASSESYRIPKQRSPGRECHGVTQEHLNDYLADGWVIKSITGIGGAADTSDSRTGCGWIAVLLEKP